ncbi:hypothetical protein Rumeso_00275 [Rubellimicrobium mesophilum DSM 19309]|uniref:Uncharacterized protein n=1 Tax=Rubellimicrobium mesophilum DSM 19309 TaxID=442562 RepID=A0A017HUS0_9RHOB|nr:hypothetical protein [Rubellimicrobium mesophilum]EYD78126.1 hypothetical protein Rumeso_00275 [Rubellimicrobium mesophilum DSM 19309]
MDELSADELRGTAFAANLRRAFGAPVEGDLPTRFAVLLDRLGEVQSPQRPRHADPHRLGA